MDQHNYEKEKIFKIGEDIDVNVDQHRERQVKDVPYSKSNRSNVDAMLWATILSMICGIYG